MTSLCRYAMESNILWVIASSYIVAFIVYTVVYAIAKKLAHRTFWTKHLVKRLRLPLLLILLEFATLFCVLSFGFSAQMTTDLSRVIGILTIGTFGAGMLITAHEVFHHMFRQLAKEAQKDMERRASLTQVIFLYRAVVIGIILLTLGAAFLVFPYIKSLGFGILGSAGVLGIAMGMAARPILLNLLAGFQIGMSKIIKIGDRVVINNQDAYVERIQLTRIILRTWDQRRILIPISQLVDQPFENWDLELADSVGSVFLHCDFTVPLEAIRNKFFELVYAHPAYNGHIATVHVTDSSALTMEIRLAMSSKDSSTNFELRCYIREKMIDYLQKEYPLSLPCSRYKNLPVPSK
ncbi:MAG: mechanosensitive ion channel [Verrucomicrobia bacterium]|nr:mechanosensitive ion channel [Verrucomicrobiota bacterium]MBS0647489.1 mechanosensitive ion channel [Verrucomicrobiota bacterium]